MPEEDDPGLLLAKRDSWAAPIFGIGHTDNETAQVPASSLVDREGLASLAQLHSILRREAPDYAVRSDAELLDKTLSDVGADLEELHTEVAELGEAIPGVLRARLLRGIARARDDITYVRFRGYGRLYQDLVTAHANAQITVHRAVAAQPDQVAGRLTSVLERLKNAVVSVEQIFLPASMGVHYGVVTGDVAGAFELAIAARRALGPMSADTTPLALPPGRPNGHTPSGDEPARK